MTGSHDADAVAVWVLGACPPDEAERVEAHLAGCPSCAAEASRLRQAASSLGAAGATMPPPALRDSVLSAAHARRRPSAPAVSELARPYAGQVAALDALLSELTEQDWVAVAARNRTVRGTVVHLAANDGMVAGDLGLGPAEPALGVQRGWREQAEAVLQRLSAGGEAMLNLPVRLAGRRPSRGPLRDALVQRTFETWIHADDIRLALHRPPLPPSAEHVHLIVGLAVRLLPDALRGLGLDHPGRTARLALTGPGGGDWLLPLAPGGTPGQPDVTMVAEAVEFCRLVADRRRDDAFGYSVHGDAALAADVLRAASTLACD